MRFFCNPTPELPCPTIFTLLIFLRYIFGGPYKTLDDIYERSFARFSFFFVLDLQKNFRCIAIDCKYFSSFFSDISTIIGREKSRKLFLKEKKARKNFGSTFLQKKRYYFVAPACKIREKVQGRSDPISSITN